MIDFLLQNSFCPSEDSADHCWRRHIHILPHIKPERPLVQRQSHNAAPPPLKSHRYGGGVQIKPTSIQNPDMEIKVTLKLAGEWRMGEVWGSHHSLHSVNQDPLEVNDMNKQLVPKTQMPGARYKSCRTGTAWVKASQTDNCPPRVCCHL